MARTGAPAVNWAGNVTFRAANVHRPASIDELRTLVATRPGRSARWAPVTRST